MLSKFIHPDDAALLHETFTMAMQTGTAYELEHRIVRPDGSIRVVYDLAHPYFDKQGKLVRYIGTTLDITERKKLDQAKDEFISLVAHELRTPLTVVLGSLKTAKTPGLTPQDIESLVENAIEGGESIDAIIQNLVELSRAQSGRLNLAARNVRVRDIIPLVLDKVHLQYPRHIFNITVPEQSYAVAVDPIRIERVIYNLVENAAKYSPEGSEITVSLACRDSEIVLSVADHGIGFPRERQSELFEPFRRLVSQSEYAKGLGLGLVVCKRLVEAHGGRIWVESKLGQGSTFFFSISLDN